ncbi:MAG: hypothetical protein ACPHJ0_00590, partial [Arenicellales bacterium]
NGVQHGSIRLDSRRAGKKRGDTLADAALSSPIYRWRKVAGTLRPASTNAVSIWINFMAHYA